MDNFCSWCGTKIFENDRACPACGAPVSKQNRQDYPTRYRGEIVEDYDKYVLEPLGQFIHDVENSEPSEYFKKKKKFSLDTIMSDIENTIWKRWTK